MFLIFKCRFRIGMKVARLLQYFSFDIQPVNIPHTLLLISPTFENIISPRVRINQTMKISLNYLIFSEDPLCQYLLLDNYKDLRDKQELIQENASLKFEVQDLLERNVALQKAITNVGKDVTQVNYVENVM